VIAVRATHESDFVDYLIESGAWEGVSVSAPSGLFSPLAERNIFEGRPWAPMHFPDAGRPAFISRDAKLEAHEKRGTGARK
jgi:hypothetical protein